MPNVTLLFHIIQVVLANTVRQGKDINHAEIEKEETGVSLFMSARISYVKNLNYAR